MHDHAQKLATLIKSATEGIGKCDIAFSGGLDSGILAYLIEEGNLCTVGVDNSWDIEMAKKSAKILGRDLNIIVVEEESIISAAKFLLENFGNLSPVEVSFEIPLVILLDKCKEYKMVTGQGADELFGGYKKYLEKKEEMGRDVEKVLKVTNPRERRMAEIFGKELIFPYLNEEIVKFALNIPDDLKIRDGVRKYILRESAKILGVPKEIYMAKKKAVQYGSGIWKSLKKIARRKGMNIDEFLLNL